MRRLAPDLPEAHSQQLGAPRHGRSGGSRLRQLLTDGTYWLNPPDHPDKSQAEFPFLALVEHTNTDRKHYGGDHPVLRRLRSAGPPYFR